METNPKDEENESMPMRIREARYDEIGEITTKGVEGLGDSPLYAWFHPQRQQYRRDFWKWRNDITKTHFYDCTSTYYVLVSLDSDGTEKEIIGTVMLQGIFDDKENKRLGKLNWNWTSWLLFWYHALFHYIWKRLGLFGSLDRSRDDLFATLRREDNLPPNIGPYLVLADLVITPNHQKQGYGTYLLKHCISIAERDKLPLVLECAPELRGFYEQEGFEQHGGAKVYHDQPRMGESEVTLVTLIWMPSSGLPDEKDGEESDSSGASSLGYSPLSTDSSPSNTGRSLPSPRGLPSPDTSSSNTGGSGPHAYDHARPGAPCSRVGYETTVRLRGGGGDSTRPSLGRSKPTHYNALQRYPSGTPPTVDLWSSESVPHSQSTVKQGEDKSTSNPAASTTSGRKPSRYASGTPPATGLWAPGDSNPRTSDQKPAALELQPQKIKSAQLTKLESDELWQAPPADLGKQESQPGLWLTNSGASKPEGK